VAADTVIINKQVLTRQLSNGLNTNCQFQFLAEPD